jgi:hypothetical protein
VVIPFPTAIKSSQPLRCRWITEALRPFLLALNLFDLSAVQVVDERVTI